MTTKQAALRNILESCSDGYAELIRLVRGEIERDFADESETPDELGVLLDKLSDAVEAAEELDAETA